MEGHAGQATDVRAANAPRRPFAPMRRALERARGGAGAAEGQRDTIPAMASLPPLARAAAVRALVAERRHGTLNSPERIERAAERLLGG